MPVTWRGRYSDWTQITQNEPQDKHSCKAQVRGWKADLTTMLCSQEDLHSLNVIYGEDTYSDGWCDTPCIKDNHDVGAGFITPRNIQA